MKKILLMTCLTFLTFSAYAKEYQKDDLNPCPQDDTLWCDGKGKLIDGAVETYYPDRTLELEWNLKDGRFEGVQKNYHKNGQLEGEMIFKAGKPDGVLKTYFEDGKLESEFKNEQENLSGTSYDNDGNIRKEFRYTNGEMTDKEYYENNILKLEKIFKVDKKDENYKLENGLIVQFRKGSIDIHTPVLPFEEGVWKAYRQDGSLTAEQYCNNDQCTLKGYDEQGKQIAELGITIKDHKVVSGYQEEPMGQRKEIAASDLSAFEQNFNGLSMFAKYNMDLYEAASAGNFKEVQEMVKEGYDVNVVCRHYCKGWTPVMIAAANGHFDTVKFLLENGANPNAQNYAGRTALMFATRYGFIPIIEVLLEHGADPTITSQDENQNSAMADVLIYSLKDQKAYDILKLFVKKTGKVNFEFWDYTPLMFALIYDDYDFAKYLLDNEADPNHIKTVEEDGKTQEFRMEGFAKSEKMKELLSSYQGKN